MEPNLSHPYIIILRLYAAALEFPPLYQLFIAVRQLSAVTGFKALNKRSCVCINSTRLTVS
ncbi:hypothetical protein H0A61_00863 [Koleobacter methoxysyntrophicus]|uniref:Uncharacterized protein n=1 Tax=Koleobacter methoxysyntrophicus TaxID=2751313 RepID=A0A8A0RMV5_9FIRM|nr:hypothetical protein [Koleobacter methoxysyntrophicus]QSQ08536.1 hypothetical protein H0A61_00863 [Koleobacter methoxysyntrophicus]